MADTTLPLPFDDRNTVTKVFTEADIERLWGRFESKYIPEPNSGCWLWEGNIEPRGYGRLRYRYRKLLAHRLSWLLHFNEDPGDKCILHRCDNPSCVNPVHLFIGTRTTNHADMLAKGRARLPQKGWGYPGTRGAVLNKTKAELIRLEHSRGNIAAAELARRYGVSPKSIWRILTRRTWT